MVSPGYLAMTAQEFRDCRLLPEFVAWMACRFSTTGQGLSNLPERLPKNALIVLTDQIPPNDHDPEKIADELSKIAADWKISGVILDFQKEFDPQSAQIAQRISDTLPCPVAVTPPYQQIGNGPILLPPVPPDCPVQKHLSHWNGRELWLEIDPDGCELTLSNTGCVRKVLTHSLSEPTFYDPKLFCHYHIRLSPEQAIFSLQRTEEDLSALLSQASEMGVTHTIGLYQQFYLSPLHHTV